MLSICAEYWQILLSQAFCVGIGGDLLVTPTISLLPTWFSTRTGLAVGIAASGSSLGGIVYPIVLYNLMLQIGFPWAVRIMAFIGLVTFIGPIVAMRLRVHQLKPRAVVHWSAFRDAPFMMFTLSVLITFIGNSVLIFYISFFRMNRHLTDTSMSFYMVAIFNGGSFAGRILPNALSDKIGVLNILAPTTLLLGAATICMLTVHNSAGMIVEAVITGFLSGVVVALPPVCFAVLTANKAVLGTRIGQGFAIGGIGLMIGGPTGDAILGTSEPLRWTGLWVYAGATVCIAAGLIFVVRIVKIGPALNVNA